MNTLPYCFFPTKVMGIGNIDNRYLSPYQALDNLTKTVTSPIFFDRLTTEGHDLFDLSSLNYLYEEIYNLRRYETVSCLVYHEKNLSQKSLSFLEEFDAIQAQKILVTQNKDEKAVITAFNEGLINFYVWAQDPQAPFLLNEFIQQSQHHYFRNFVNALIDPLLEKWQQDHNTLSPLLDPVFIEFFQAFIKTHHITEYYLLDITGSFLLLDYEKQASVFFVFNEQSFREHGQAVDRFLHSNHCLPAEIVEDLKSRRQTICFPFIYPSGPVHVERYIEPVQALQGQHNYYIAHSKGIDYLKEF
ncbi:MAG: hypothetical protein K0M45_09495 [Candidatus Paracaedibacteraceae bacterium]|nr:hypothetical protein [Candidatus Paracaedibacteraceae bacterium]